MLACIWNSVCLVSSGQNAPSVPLHCHAWAVVYMGLMGRFIFAPFRCDWFATQGASAAVWDPLSTAVGFMNRSNMHLSIIWNWMFVLQWPRDRLRNLCVCLCTVHVHRVSELSVCPCEVGLCVCILYMHAFVHLECKKWLCFLDIT